jgi:hypothetical protein
MPFSLAQSFPAMEPILSAGATAVLGLVTVLLVVALAATLRALIVARRNGNMEAADEIAKNIALIEREGIDLPRNWRDWVDARIQHKQKNNRANQLSYAYLIEHGKGDVVAKLLREEADEDR